MSETCFEMPSSLALLDGITIETHDSMHSTITVRCGSYRVTVKCVPEEIQDTLDVLAKGVALGIVYDGPECQPAPAGTSEETQGTQGTEAPQETHGTAWPGVDDATWFDGIGVETVDADHAVVTVRRGPARVVIECHPDKVCEVLEDVRHTTQSFQYLRASGRI